MARYLPYMKYIMLISLLFMLLAIGNSRVAHANITQAQLDGIVNSAISNSTIAGDITSNAYVSTYLINNPYALNYFLNNSLQVGNVLTNPALTSIDSNSIALVDFINNPSFPYVLWPPRSFQE
jgi:hypothetical protein